MSDRGQVSTPGAHRQPGQAVGKAAPCPRSPVGVKDSFHLGDVGLERYGTEFIQLLVVEQQVLIPETNGLEGAKDRNWGCRSALELSTAHLLWRRRI